MTGRQVKHVTFGIGSIIGYESGKIAVDFSGTIRLFQFPESFGRFLITDDIVLQGMVADAIKEKEAIKQKAEEERQIPKDPNALQVTHTASDAPFTEQNKTLFRYKRFKKQIRAFPIDIITTMTGVVVIGSFLATRSILI
jgi:hypothetical protein